MSIELTPNGLPTGAKGEVHEATNPVIGFHNPAENFRFDYAHELSPTIRESLVAHMEPGELAGLPIGRIYIDGNTGPRVYEQAQELSKLGAIIAGVTPVGQHERGPIRHTAATVAIPVESPALPVGKWTKASLARAAGLVCDGRAAERRGSALGPVDARRPRPRRIRPRLHTLILVFYFPVKNSSPNRHLGRVP